MGVDVNKSKNIVVKRGGDAVCKVKKNGEMLELVNEFKYIGCVNR